VRTKDPAAKDEAPAFAEPQGGQAENGGPRTELQRIGHNWEELRMESARRAGPCSRDPGSPEPGYSKASAGMTKATHSKNDPGFPPRPRRIRTRNTPLCRITPPTRNAHAFRSSKVLAGPDSAAKTKAARLPLRGGGIPQAGLNRLRRNWRELNRIKINWGRKKGPGIKAQGLGAEASKFSASDVL
jgi:hypothetical protein